MKRGLVLSVLIGAAVGAGGLGGVAWAAPKVKVDPKVGGGHVRPTVGTYEQTGEYDYTRDFVTGDASTKGATLNYESYSTSYTTTSERNQTVDVDKGGASYTDSYDEWHSAGEGHSDDTNAVSWDHGVVSVSQEASVPDCTTGVEVNVRVFNPTNSDVVNDEYC